MKLECFLIAAIIICVYYIAVELCGTEGFNRVKSDIDGNHYHLLRDYKNHQEAADTFGNVNSDVMRFLEYLKKKYNINEVGKTPGDDEATQIVRRVCTNYNYERIYETKPTGRDGTSYTVDKGEKLFMCLRNKKTLDIHDEEIIMFVILHEIAHMGNKGWGHNADFWETFKFILNESHASGVYISRDFRKHPDVYCGLDIDYNPFYDKSVRTIAMKK